MSIEGYSNSYSNNIEGNSTDSILQGEIDLINYNITDITFNGTNKTTIDNDLEITGVLTIPSFSNVKTTLENYNTSINSINSTLTGISYSIDTTQIDNDLTLTAGKILAIPNFPNVGNELTKLSAIDYSDGDYTTFVYSIFQVDNTFTLPSYPDVKITLDNLSSSALAVTGITYNSITDTTSISNNLTIGTGKVLSIPNYSNVETTLTTFNTNLTGITYSSVYPLYIPKTTIAHNLELASNKKLTCDEIWCKYYSTHDINDEMGVGFFKTWIYNEGSICYISTINPINEFDSTSSEVVIKVSTREMLFNVDGLSLNGGSITLCNDIELPDYASVSATLDTLTSEIATINSTLSTITSIPAGTIISSMATTAPAGYLALNGQLVLIASYSALYAIVGTVWNALYTPGVPTGYFYLGDTKGAFLRGVGTNGMTTYSHCQGSYVGGFQIDLVKEHNHQYQVSSGTQDVSVGTATARNNSTDTYHTSNELYNASNVAFGHTENRVFNMSVNYYIKY